MKIIQVSDPHLVRPGELLHGSDPLARLEDCLADLDRHHADADLVVFSGDLTDDGEPSAYAALAERLPALAMPYRLMLGNHDDRAAFAAAFPGRLAADGFAHAAADLGGWRVVMLDTLEPGHVEGRLDAVRFGWLETALAGAADVLMFLHHPPFAIGIPSLDSSRLMDSERLMAVLRRHGTVRHLFAGHVHRLASGHWGGIPFAAARSTNHQSALAFTGPHRVSFEAPAYQVILAGTDGIAVHAQEFPCRDRQGRAGA